MMRHLAPALMLMVALVTPVNGAEPPARGDIAVEHAWARATPPGARTGAAYMTLVNKGTAADRLIGAATPEAESVQFHSTTNDNGVMRMREVSSIDLKPGDSIAFDPGHLHIMLLGLRQPLKEGQTLPLTLKFEKAGDVAVAVPIQRIGAMSGDMSPMQ